MAVRRCRTCRAPIVWAVTVNHKSIPLDAVPNDDGNVIVAASGSCHVEGNGTLPLPLNEGEARYMPHHATCTNWGK